MRILLDPPKRGHENMARDEALLAEGTPTVRLYAWKPATISLGRAQTEADIDTKAAHEWGLDIVRRATGGGGILHNETEITYAVILPLDWPQMPRDIAGSFAYLSQAIVNTLQSFGVDAQIESVPESTRDALCYVRKQGTNVVVNHRKISGGAQRRTATHILQHGTLILDRDEDRTARIFRENVDTIRTRVTSLAEEGLKVSREKLVETLAREFQFALKTD